MDALYHESDGFSFLNINTRIQKNFLTLLNKIQIIILRLNMF